MTASLPQFALVFMEPLALAGLAAPVLLLALGLRRQDSREAYLGTTRFLTGDVSGQDGQRKRSLPLWLLMAALALALGVLALAKPGFEGAPPEGVVVELKLDRSPSMYLPHGGADPTLSPPADRRIDVAWRAFSDWAQDHDAAIPGGVFVTSGGEEPVPWHEFDLPAAPEIAAPEVFWPAHDEPSAIWITDRTVDDSVRQHAGLFASGGAAVPGPVSMGAEGGIYWKADGTTEFRESRDRSGRVRVAASVPSTVAELLELWAAARGLEWLVDGGDDPVELSVKCVLRADEPQSSSEQVAARSGRDGWEAELVVDRLGASYARVGDGWTPWLLGPAGQPLVSIAPGRIELGFMDLVGAPTDEAAFAVSWIGLFDRARLAPTEVVPASERSAAGAAFSAGPSLPAKLESPGARAKRERRDERAAALRALLAGASALLGLAAIVVLLKRG